MELNIFNLVSTVLFGIIGFLVVRLLNNIDGSIKELKSDMKAKEVKISEHDIRLTKLETEHDLNH